VPTRRVRKGGKKARSTTGPKNDAEGGEEASSGLAGGVCASSRGQLAPPFQTTEDASINRIFCFRDRCESSAKKSKKRRGRTASRGDCMSVSGNYFKPRRKDISALMKRDARVVGGKKERNPVRDNPRTIEERVYHCRIASESLLERNGSVR